MTEETYEGGAPELQKDTLTFYRPKPLTEGIPPEKVLQLMKEAYEWEPKDPKNWLGEIFQKIIQKETDKQDHF